MTSYVTWFLGGYLADNWLGRFKTILIFATLYFVGTATTCHVFGASQFGESDLHEQADQQGIRFLFLYDDQCWCGCFIWLPRVIGDRLGQR